ncbi:MAG: hypothetical protein QOE28_2453 [Solirubrobacteraceae bacterium]|nr:hypothetical protein [Solirubrobacteraceae bacterium]
MTDLPDPLDPDAAALAGAAIGQLASRLPDGGLLLSTSRLVEFNCRAAILLAPGVFRFDLTPQQETLGVMPRPLGEFSVHWRAEESSWDAYREQSRDDPLELRGLIEHPTGHLLAWVHVLSFTDRDAAAVHFVAKAELRRPQE